MTLSVHEPKIAETQTVVTTTKFTEIEELSLSIENKEKTPTIELGA